MDKGNKKNEQMTATEQAEERQCEWDGDRGREIICVVWYNERCCAVVATCQSSPESLY